MHAAAATEEVQIVRLFGRFDCLIEPALVDHLAKDPSPEHRAEAVLKAMGEVPFYLTLAQFRDVEDRLSLGARSKATAAGGSGRASPAMTPPAQSDASAHDVARAVAAPGTHAASPSPTPPPKSDPIHPVRPAEEAARPGPHGADAALDPTTHSPGVGDVATDEAPGTALRDDVNEAARKAALAKMLELVYDRRAQDADALDDEDDAVDDHDDELNVTAKRELAEWELDWSKPFTIQTQGTWKPTAARYDGDIKITQDITGRSTCEGTTDDFHKYFKSRFHQMERILKRRRELANAMTVEKAMESSAREVAMIGMVAELRTTANGHWLIQLEDETAQQACLVVNNERTEPALLQQAGVLVPDEVIGIVGQKTTKGDLIIVQELIRPDIPYNQERHMAEEPLAAVFLSDVHVGSDLFLEKNFMQMVRWLNGETGTGRERDMAGRVKYFVLPGDMIDGVGIYPGQEEDLKFTDVYDQYRELGRLLTYLPDHLEVIIQPGNHDATRPNEPQPALDNEVKESFDGVQGTFVGNPSMLNLNGVRILSYHGVSLMDFATSVRGLEHHDPVPIMEEILKCRHLAPIYGMTTPLAPEHQDYMVIEEVPELFVTGHVHTYNTRNYRGVHLMNCSTWQAQTDYQKMLNFKPNPCQMPIFDLQKLKSTAMDFTMGMDFGFRGPVKVA